MSLSSVAGTLLKPQTCLQQLLEDINFQRTKEMRQMLKDDSGFVVLQGTTYWTDLFVRHFLFQTEPVHSIDSDDLLFFVRKKHVKSSSRHMPKYETEVEVFRKDSRKLPIGDPDVDWEETVYLNMVIHKFDYTLTLAICTRTSPKELQVLRRHSQRVYASPSRRKMDTKGEGEEITYPHICFMVDNFDEVFSDILVRDGEMVCVELVANDKDGAVQGVIFLGSIRYDALKQVYDARQSSLSSKVAQRMSFGLFSSGASVQTRCEFVRMKGPQGKGHAEMAVTKPKGSGVETPTSEPGFCATDMWDDWDQEENDDYCTYRHQRRLSDPSSNFNNFVRHSWRTKNPTESGQGATGPGVKARSENEGLDSLANEVSEIEAGDLRDDQQLFAFSASAAKLHTNPLCDAQENKKTPDELANGGTDSPVKEATEAIVEDETINNSPEKKTKTTENKKIGCGNCFSGNKLKKRKNKNFSTPEMSEVYCPSCDKEDVANATAECLNKVSTKKITPKPRSILSAESELIISRRGSLRIKDKKPLNRSASLSAADRLKTRLRLEKEQQKERKEKQLLKEKKKPILSKPKEIKEIKEKDKLSKTSNLLCKISPKKIRKKIMTEENTKKETTTRSRSESDNNKNSIELMPKTKKQPIKNTKEHISTQEYEIADDATSFSNEDFLEPNDNNSSKIAVLSDNDKKSMISVNGKEELPQTTDKTTTTNNNPYNFDKCVPVELENRPLKTEEQQLTKDNINIENNITKKDQENNDAEDFEVIEHETMPMLPERPLSEHVTTLPRNIKRINGNSQAFYNRALDLVPKRRTRDGTNIYYWCDLPKKVLKELDDGAYNPLWASRGFTQTYHFWKEHRRAQCVPLNAFLTYVTLPWWSIAKDLLDHKETPILTF